MNRHCFVHSERKNMAIGYIQHVARKWMDVTMSIDGVDYNASCKISSVVKSQQKLIVPGRYFSFLTDKQNKKIHLCTCKWSQQEIEKVMIDAKKLSKRLCVQ